MMNPHFPPKNSSFFGVYTTFYDSIWYVVSPPAIPASAQWLPPTEAEEVAPGHADVGPTPGLALRGKGLPYPSVYGFPSGSVTTNGEHYVVN